MIRVTSARVSLRLSGVYARGRVFLLYAFFAAGVCLPRFFEESLNKSSRDPVEGLVQWFLKSASFLGGR